MHFARLLLENVRDVDAREHDFTASHTQLRRWIWLPSGPPSSARLRALALAGLGVRQAELLSRRFSINLADNSGRPTHIEFVQVRHAPQERGPAVPALRHSGWKVSCRGQVTVLGRAAMRLQVPNVPSGAPELGRNHAGRLLLAYGRRPQAHAGTDWFWIGPDQRVKRCAGLFQSSSRLTDPEAFLRGLQRKSLYRAGRARALLASVNSTLTQWLGWEPVRALDAHGVFAEHWKNTSVGRRFPGIVFLDIVRHLYDASTDLDVPDPRQQPGVILMDAPEAWCPVDRLGEFFEMLDEWLPKIQFFVALSPRAREFLPARLTRQVLEIPAVLPARAARPARRVPPGAVLLVDVDGRLPNLALMKLSRHYRCQGRKVMLIRGVKDLPPAQTVLASCTFATAPSLRRVERLRQRYGDALQVGGSGVDLRRRLTPEIESRASDYSLYPELGERAIGFLTRGCPQHCPFCVVPVKEGPPRLVGDFDAILQGRKKLILLDDNLLAHPAALELLEEMARRDLEVNFNQTLDLRRLNADSAQLLRRIRCANVTFSRRNYHFSLNDARSLERIRDRYAFLRTTSRDNVEFVCMYGFNTTLAEDVQRFRFLRSLPGAYVFVQRYRPILGGPPPDLSRLFDRNADALLDELVRVIFPQNMKSMETYYRWIAVQYAARCRRIHRGLVETLFRYNCRPQMAGYLHRLSELARSDEIPLELG